MNNYLTTARELKKENFRDLLSVNERKILSDLLFKAPYKITTYNLYGMKIYLEKYELCFLSVKLVRFYEMAERHLKTLLKKFERIKLLMLKNDKGLCEFSNDKSNDKLRDKSISKCNIWYVYVTLCGSGFVCVFASENESENKPLETEFLETNQKTNHEHNK